METVRSTVEARKTHRCEVCGWDIEPGTTYDRIVTFDGDVLTWKSHPAPCSVAADRSWLDGYEDCGLIDADSVAEWASERAESDEFAAEVHRRLVINSERAQERWLMQRQVSTS